jgi:cold-inducible RNA-binding protein
MKQMDIYVGNLPYTATEEDVIGLFTAYGPVERVKIITDRETGRSKGFAFVTIGDQTQLNAAIEALNGYDYQGRALRVNASEPKEARPSGGGGYGGERRGGGGGGYGGGGDRRGGGYKGGGGGYKGGGGGGYKGGGGNKGGHKDSGGWD